jgi:hypothetical protein
MLLLHMYECEFVGEATDVDSGGYEEFSYLGWVGSVDSRH